LINKEDSSDEELTSDNKYESEEGACVTSKDQHPDEKKHDKDPDDDKGKEESYQDSAMFSKEDYKGFAFVQDVTFCMNDKARIPDIWILLDSQSTVDVS